jgi:acetyltransferase-like isoleucine patch superfamily enzyme
MRKGSHHTEETKRLFKESNKESIIKAGKARLENYENKHPKRKDNPYTYLRSRNLLRDFGILLSEYNELFEKQKGCCAICGIHQNIINPKKSLGVDHDHRTGKIRGLLCDRCNRAIGLLNDNINSINSAEKYLTEHSGGFLNSIGIRKLGLKSVGKNVLISHKASFHTKDIIIGDNVRIDDFCILSGNIKLGNNIHIGAYCGLYGKYGITFEDFTGLSPRCTVFSASDDFSGDYLISPMTPDEFTNVTGGTVLFSKYSQVGCNTVIMPRVKFCTGAVVGAMSYVKHSIPEWEIWGGNPFHYLKDRNKGMIELSSKYLTNEKNIN